MKSPNPSAGRALAIERQARKMYEGSNPGPKPWLRLGWSVREAWLVKAREALDAPSSTLERLNSGLIARLFS